MKTKEFRTDKEVVLSHPYIKDVLVYDIETDSLDTTSATVKFFGAYSYKHEKYYIIDEQEKGSIQRLIDDHRVLVGFNNKDFDGPIMENTTNQYNLEYKITFDCLKVLYDYQRKRANREVVIKINGKTLQESLPNRKLKTVAEVMGFPILKGDIDYHIFRQNEWTDEELKNIHTYLFKDVEITRLFFEFLLEYFEPYRDYVSDENVRRFDYIRSSLGSYAYSAICNLAGLEVEFEDDEEKKEMAKNDTYKGGFVLDPKVEYAENCTYLDFISLYPSIYIQCNLFTDDCTCCTEEEKWKGDSFFDVQGRYCSKKRGKVEEILKYVFTKRKEFKKKKDERELPLKILLNSIYGISSSPIFKSIHHKHCASDCTSIGRKCIQYTIERFKEFGVETIYADTDSCFVLNGDKKTEEITHISDIIVKEIQSHMPFAF